MTRTMKKIPVNARAFWCAEQAASVGLFWLGQAGFLIRHENLRVAIDPYLSDYLGKKYRGRDKPHDRLMQSPLTVKDLDGINYVLCTHRHSDHMDPETLPAISELHPECRFVVPSAEMDYAIKLGLPRERLMGINAGNTISLSTECCVSAIAAAHETIETNSHGDHRYLGYLLKLGSLTLYHSGDTVPYPGLEECLKSKIIDLALLPINGRGRGVSGNFTFEEATALCRSLNIPLMIPHHFGMFAFNTVEREKVAQWATETSSPVCYLPDIESKFLLEN
jgi:L-ascorbate metabolism protein UlaG (beta-lactamase superfamily)